AYANNMYYAVKHYFDNGGGPCYIHSVGGYARTNVDVNTYKDELAKLDLVDEVTLIILPDLAALNNKDQYYDVYNNALQKVSSLQDKFVVIDVNIEKVGGKVSAEKSKTEFRNTISNNIDLIKYGAAYFPHLDTTYSYDYATADIKMTFAADVMSSNAAANLLHNINYKTAKEIFIVNSALSFLNDEYFKNISTETYTNKISEINSKRNGMISYFDTAGQQTLIDNTKRVTEQVKIQADAAIAAAQPKFDFTDTAANEKATLLGQLQAKISASYGALDAAIKTDLETNKGVDPANFGTLNTTFLSRINPFFNSIFEARLKEAFLSIPLILPPSPSIAGVYGSVDRNRGVWKAPANVSLNAVKKPEVQLSDLDQEDFNVDAENGKSINCIRQFVGRGNLVWGARTLAGNNNEWR
ncbi:MAG TPA: hypothetical protein VM187_03950, partial [Niastella sp.]|nr:hypothetical protein [Niastella sp.]